MSGKTPNRASRRANRSRQPCRSSYRWEVEKGDAFDDAAALISKMTCHVFKGKPSQIIGTRERAGGRVLGLKATYGRGETVRIRFRKDGSYSVEFGLSIATKVAK
ncbi:MULTISPECIES: hypothetical protein [unclassified Sphingopyxis]|uniref:hypothetical protein n=1 Tax=unclassified Sphingopyxis TaxID=2614943 RepID=UPI000A765C47|nr:MULTISPECIES: hypothetical protein [unclassified Sphingopyxis]